MPRTRTADTEKRVIPGTQDLAIYQGDDYFFSFRVRNPSPDGGATPGDPIDLTGSTAKAQIRSTASDASVLAEFTCIISETQDIGSPTRGVVTISLSNIQTTALAVPQTAYEWDVQLTDSGGHIQTYLRGKVTVQAEVTR